MISAYISAIEYYLPEKTLDNGDLSKIFPEWTPAQIEKKTGIKTRHIAGAEETSTDMAVKAAQGLFLAGKAAPGEIDFVILCTQSPDYLLPTSACLIQDRLGIPTSSGALDINLGCSGFVYALSLAKGLIETGSSNSVLLITSETYSKFLDPVDKNVRTLFGDGSAATLIKARKTPDDVKPGIGPFSFGTDGSGADTLIVRSGGLREHGTTIKDPFLRMDGPSIFSFTLSRIPQLVAELLGKAKMGLHDIDLFIFHQANTFILEALRKAIGIPPERFVIDIAEKGNTVSSTIPIALADAISQGKIGSLQNIMLVGFGVGLSWAATVVRMAGADLDKGQHR
jgi:3-oxoacyl-[acyl-carrier-protein] synthase-3